MAQPWGWFGPASLAVLLAISIPSLYGAERSGSVSGVVQVSSGAPAVGAMVKVRNLGVGLTVSVISREDGRFTVPDLPAGSYTIQAMGGGFQSDPNAAVEVSAGQAGTKSLTLSHRQNWIEAMTSSQFAARMPEGDGKDLIVSLCTHCHKDGLYKIVSRRMNREDWGEALRKMETNVFGNTHPVELTDRDRKVILDYLAKYYGPDTPPLDPERDMAKTWITGAAAKNVVTEYDLPPGASPHDVAVDAQGICWVAESRPGVIGRLDPQTLTYTRIPIPETKANTEKRSVSAAHALALDEQGRLWLSDHRTPNPRAVQYDPKTGKFTFYPYPAPKRPEESADVNTIRIHPNGTVWFTDLGSDQILRLNPATKDFTQIPVPAGLRSKIKAHPYGMAIDGDGWIWFAEYETDKMGRIDAKSGEVTEYDLATPRAYPRRMGTDANGNVWFGEYGGVGKLGRVDRRTAKITEYPTPIKYSGAYSVSVDTKRNLIWVSELIADQIARFDPRTKTFVEYPLPTHYSSVRRIEADPSRPHRVWYSGNNTNKVGYLDVLE
ncbi:MAG: hypothetical protein A3J28_13420 [Acidobacteria bacterium RIFCSPLOWO2_12_FULL_60_22]|nr:MAG: hypothetical protein A3J28_13420 [Acidobacteria bacterium RIFCSPLOWO2_12_FULL_60_22]